MAFRGSGRGTRGAMPGPTPVNTGARGPPLIPGAPFPPMVPGFRPGMRSGFYPRGPRGLPPRIPPSGIPRGLPPPVHPGVQPGLAGPGMPPHPMHIVPHPEMQQALLQGVPRVVMARTPVFLPANVQVLGMPPPPRHIAAPPAVSQSGPVPHKVTAPANNQPPPPGVNTNLPNRQSRARNSEHRHSKREARDLDEGEIIDEEEYDDKSYERDSRHDHRRSERLHRNDRRGQDTEPRHNDDRRYDDRRGTEDEPYYDRDYDERHEEDRRRDRNWDNRERRWDDREQNRGYEGESLETRDEDYYRHSDGRRREYDGREIRGRGEDRDRGRDSLREDRGYSNERYDRDQRDAYYNRDRHPERARSAERSPRRRTSVDDRAYRDNRDSDRRYDYDERRRFNRDERDYGREIEFNDDRDRHRDNRDLDRDESYRSRERDNYEKFYDNRGDDRNYQDRRRGREYIDEYDSRRPHEERNDREYGNGYDNRRDDLGHRRDDRGYSARRDDPGYDRRRDGSQYQDDRRYNDRYQRPERRERSRERYDRRDPPRSRESPARQRPSRHESPIQQQHNRDENPPRYRHNTGESPKRSRRETVDSKADQEQGSSVTDQPDERVVDSESTKTINATATQPIDTTKDEKEAVSDATCDKANEAGEKNHDDQNTVNIELKDIVGQVDKSADYSKQSLSANENSQADELLQSDSKPPETRQRSRSPNKRSKSSPSRSQRSPSMTKQSKPTCDHQPPDASPVDSIIRSGASRSSQSHKVLSPSKRRHTSERTRSHRSSSHRPSSSRGSVSPRKGRRDRSSTSRETPGRDNRTSSRDSRDRQHSRGFSSERSSKKAVAVVPPRKRSPLGQQGSSAKMSRVDRSLPTDQTIRDRDSQGRPLDEIPLGESSRSEERSSATRDQWNPDQADNDEEDIEAEFSTPVPAWTRSSPADLYFSRNRKIGDMIATKRMLELEDKFEDELLKRAAKARALRPKYEKPERAAPVHHHHHHHGACHNHSDSDSSSSSSDDDSEEENERMSQWMEELMAKKQHPDRLHEELWFNEDGEMNDGPLCRCSLKSRKTGIRHDIYPGEGETPVCDQNSNNGGKLYCYRISMSPSVNFLSKRPTIIKSDNHEFIFEGFSILSHYQIENVPVCKVIRFNIEYTIHWFEEEAPENFDVRSLDLFSDYVFDEILELKDFKSKLPATDTCRHFHVMPRFSRKLRENGKEMLSMNEVLLYLLKSAKPVVDEGDLPRLAEMDIPHWEDWVDSIRAMIIARPGLRPSSIRIDQLDREKLKRDASKKTFPIIVHFGIRPAQLSYAGDPNYQKLWKQYVKLKHLLANKPKVCESDKRKLMALEDQLQDLRMKSSMKREVTVELSSQNFVKTGIKSDICQHAMLLPVLIGHLRFHKCLNALEDRISYKFKDRMLIQLALTHPSYRVNFGTNPDHARNSLSNCGFRQPEYGDRRIHHVHNRKRGINTLINIMSRMGRKQETTSEINHYERLEFLGDAVVEFLSSIHLFYMFPNLEEGGLATYRAAIVQNQHLALLAKKLKLQEYMLYAHGPDLCHESDLKHAMANCLEALMGALFLDGGIDLADRVFGEVLFDDDEKLLETWINLSRHPLQEDEPSGDRHWIQSSPVLQKLVKFEEETGIPFNHVRLLARAFTMRNVGFNNLTFGHNQRLEFLGDTVLQIVASEYLFKHFPEHHEGHLSLLRSSLVNNFTQAVVCDDLGMTDYIIHSDARLVDKDTMKHKEKADLLEAYIGALYVDRDLEYCQVFSNVCFFPRLKQFIMNQDWNDPKSQLQQCCLTLRELEGGEPDIPIYKMIESTGPTNTRKYTVAVYFREKRLATGTGHSIQMAEMAAATNALKDKSGMFPQLDYQKKFVEKKYKMGKEIRQRRKRENPGNKRAEETGNNHSDGKRAKSPTNKTSRDRHVTPENETPSKVSRNSVERDKNSSSRCPRRWSSPSTRGGFQHRNVRTGHHHRSFGPLRRHHSGFGGRGGNRSGPVYRGHHPRPRQ